MQEDKDINIYIGVTDNCGEAIIAEVDKCCHLLTNKNSNGGQLLLVTENDRNYLLANYIINIEKGDIFLTRGDKAFNVKLDRSNSLADVLHALTASWFLANLVGHDYADYVSCLNSSKNLQLDIIEIHKADDLQIFLSEKAPSSPSFAITCNVEAVESNLTLEWFEKVGNVLIPFVDDETTFVMSVSAKAIKHAKSKIYLTRLYQ